MIWVWAAALAALTAFTGFMFMVFYPEWPPIDAGVHRAGRGRRRMSKRRSAFLDENLEEIPERTDPPLPLGPSAEEWMWSTDGAKRHRPRHRYDDLGQGTIRLPWYEEPQTGDQPLYPDV